MDPYHHIRQHYQPPSRPELHQKCNRGSHSSDTSSAYSGSDTMASVYGSSLDGEEIDFSGLVESTVDSDEEDLAESMDSLNVRDAVRDCLEKDPSERTEEDVEILLEFTQGLKAFTNITLAVRRALCSVMVFAVVDKAGTVVMSDGEELDSWSVLINGVVEIEHANGEREELQVGDSFGILPTMDKLYHKGVMRTKCDDCQFVCITQTDYYRIQHQGEENTRRHEDEDGRVVMVTELRQIGSNDGTAAGGGGQGSGANAKRGHVVIRGTPERLLQQLVEENSMTDPFYVEDFLLTHRIFIKNSQEVTQKLLNWFEADVNGMESAPKFASHATAQEIRDRVTRVVLLWVNNHFTDFEADHEMMEFLEIFEAGLERKKLLSQLRLLHIACAAKARNRSCTLTRSSRDESLNFKIIGGYEMRGACVATGGCGIYISHVEKDSKAQEAGLKRGDQIHEVNGQSFEHVTSKRALEILMGSTHLSITVKSNLLGFKEMMQAVELTASGGMNSANGNMAALGSKSLRSPRRICANDVAKLHGRADSTSDDMTAAANRAHIVRLSSVDMLLHSTAGEDQTDRGLPSPGTPVQSSGNMASNFMNNLLQSVNASGKKDPNAMQGNGGGGGGGDSKGGGFMTLAPKRRLQKALAKMNLLHKNVTGLQASNLNDSSDALLNVACSEKHKSGSLSSASSSSGPNGGGGGRLYQSQSNPDLTSLQYEDNSTTSTLNPGSYLSASVHRPSAVSTTGSLVPDYPEHVLKVFKADQTCKYLLINKETTAHEVVMLALQEFGIHDPSSNFSLCEVSVGEGGMVKQRRLPDQLQNLAERIGFASRYYLKTNGISETLVPDELALELVRESNVHFLQLNAYELAIQLTLQDFSTFRQIESTEYVDDLFNLKTKYGVPMLSKFSELVNREMFWVVTEICSEHNIVRRMKIVKQFIKIARHCKECRNFNSMFAIISGLGHAAVYRLRQTWEKLPSKYQRLFSDLQDLMDPSRNMSKYRQLVSSELLNQHPIIPFYPIVRKDLTFIHLGNDTIIEDLINFEKLRMIAKEVRLLSHMCSSPYDLLAILELKGQSPSNAMFSLNQMSTSQGGSNQGPTLIAANAGNATIKRRKKSTAAPNPKKMFEEAQMVRRVKAYLNNLKIINDEDILHKFSLECEPAHTSTASTSSQHGGNSSRTGGDQLSIYSHTSNSSSAPNSSLSLRKRHPSSPTLSTTSSTSSTSDNRRNINPNCPKFGTASPQAVRKILSLSESTKIRPHQPFPRPPATLPGNIPLLSNTHLHGFNAAGVPVAAALASSSTPTPSPCSHRRLTPGSSNSMPATMIPPPVRSIHERSHSDTPAPPPPLPSVDLNLESSSVTTFRDLPLRKSVTSGSVSSNDSGHGSYAQHDTSSSSSVYTAADCRLLQQISNTAATRTLNTPCNTRALSPQLHTLQQQQQQQQQQQHLQHPATPPPPQLMNAPLQQQQQQQHQPPLTPTPPPYLMRGQNMPMYPPPPPSGSGLGVGVGGGSGNISPHPPPPTPPQHMNSRPLSPVALQSNMPPPYATAAAMLHHNHRHSNMHEFFF
ncbi:rap guanine nucleotide exchange factor 2 isoform X2 [Musca domestica]|uniref:Rap guanine nucleotide exchange factor 2 isoform X2 n=1 Tax=Musca domestica TaxID=7370 RepID=A0ABM3V8F4_MUSDO|nr:rap guanine nucleotide exchange factor 2 isoform X2 [Musca domestica]